MVENKLSSIALLFEIKARDGISPRRPASRTPGLDDSFVRQKLEMPSYDMATEQRKRAANIAADVRGPRKPAEFRYLCELLRVRKRVVDPLTIRFWEDHLLMDGLRGPCDLVVSDCQCILAGSDHRHKRREAQREFPAREGVHVSSSLRNVSITGGSGGFIP